MIAAIGAAGTTLFIIAALAWTARLVHVGNLDALVLAQKVGTPVPISALEWPELHVRTVVSLTDEPPVVPVLADRRTGDRADLPPPSQEVRLAGRRRAGARLV